MNLKELIAKLREFEEENGTLPVYLEAKCTGANLMDEAANIIETYTISPLMADCVVDTMDDGMTKAVWLTGSVVAAGNDEPSDD
jgi:hypothetical protein